MIKVMSIMPAYDSGGQLLSCNVSVEIKLASGETGTASFLLGTDEIDFNAIGERIKQKVLQGLSEE